MLPPSVRGSLFTGSWKKSEDRKKKAGQDRGRNVPVVILSKKRTLGICNLQHSVPLSMNGPLCFCAQGCKGQKKCKSVMNNKTYVACSKVNTIQVQLWCSLFDCPLIGVQSLKRKYYNNDISSNIHVTSYMWVLLWPFEK